MPNDAHAPVAIAALTQDRALVGLLRSTVDATQELIFVTSEAELVPHLNGRRVSVALLDSMYIEGDLASMAERLRDQWPDLVLVVVGTAEEQSKVAAQITSGVVYRFLHRPVSAPRVRLFVEAALRRHEVEYVERTLEQTVPDFSKAAQATPRKPAKNLGGLLRIVAAALVVAAAAGWYFVSDHEGAPAPEAVAEVVSPPEGETAAAPAASRSPATSPADSPANSPASAAAPRAQLPEEKPMAAAPAPVETAKPSGESVTDRLRDAPPATAPVAQANAPAQDIIPPTAAESVPQTLPPAPVLSREQQVSELLAQAEAALQRGELASPADKNAMTLFRAAQELDPGNTLARGGLVRVADRLLSAAERALTAGNAEDAKAMVNVAESLTPATARGAFISMQIEMERERAALTRTQTADTQDKSSKGATYLRLANTRLRTGALVEPSEDNARFYLEAARQTIPDDPAVEETSRALQKELLTRAATAAVGGNAADTERLLANADSAGAGRPEIAAIRRTLQETLIGARTDNITTLVQSFNGALTANNLLAPANTSAKGYLLQLINTDGATAAVGTARQALGAAYLREMKGALARGDLKGAEAWAGEAATIGYANDELATTEADLAARHAAASQANSVVGANSLARVEYVAPKFPSATLGRSTGGWVELEFTVKKDGSTADIVVTNSSPRRVFDSSAVNAISQWRYKPVLQNGTPVDQRAAIRIRFSEE